MEKEGKKRVRRNGGEEQEEGERYEGIEGKSGCYGEEC